MKVLYY